MMRLYHGTTSDFGEINLTKSKPGKDFGLYSIFHSL